MSRTHLYLLLALFLSTQFTFMTAQDDDIESSDEFSSTLSLSDELEGTDSIEDLAISATDDDLNDESMDTDTDTDTDTEEDDTSTTTPIPEEAAASVGTTDSVEAAEETEAVEVQDEGVADSDSVDSSDDTDTEAEESSVILTTDSIEDTEDTEAGDEAVDDDTLDAEADSVDIEDTSTTPATEEAASTSSTSNTESAEQAEEAEETEATEAADDDDTDSDSASSEESVDDDDMDDIDDTTTSEIPRDIAMDAFEEGSAEENALDEGLASDGRNSGGLVSGKDAQNGTIDSKGVWIAIGSVIGLLVAFVGCGGFWLYKKSKWNGTKSTMDKIANLEMEVCIDQPHVSEDGVSPVSDKATMPSKYGEVEQDDLLSDFDGVNMAEDMDFIDNDIVDDEAMDDPLR